MRILAFSGSTRRDSFNQRLVAIAATAAADAGSETTLVSLNELPMPLYDADLEATEGLPETARSFRNLLKAADGILIASPEYNGGMSAVLKNAIDWSTRSDPTCGKEEPLIAWRGKVVGIMACSPGRLGGLRGLTHVRTILSGLGSLIVPDQVAVPGVHELFGTGKTLSNEHLQTSVAAIGLAVATLAASVRSNASG